MENGLPWEGPHAGVVKGLLSLSSKGISSLEEGVEEGVVKICFISIILHYCFILTVINSVILPKSVFPLW